MMDTRNQSEREPTRDEVNRLPGAVLLEFGAEWCGYCQAIQSSLAELLRTHPEVRHIKIEDGKGKPLGRSYRVKLWPTLVFLRDGKVVHRTVRPSVDEMRAGFDALAS